MIGRGAAAVAPPPPPLRRSAFVRSPSPPFGMYCEAYNFMHEASFTERVLDSAAEPHQLRAEGGFSCNGVRACSKAELHRWTSTGRTFGPALDLDAALRVSWSK